MAFQMALAKGIASLCTWGLKHVFRRPAANFPGKIALYVDPRLIADLGRDLKKGSVVVSGTNGKTTVTALLASTLEACGMSVAWNRTGANLDSGIASALLQSPGADWGVFECDELWVAKVLPGLESAYLLLLNLFPDQLDRFGESSVIAQSIEAALKNSPKTVFVYNADDPLCAAIAAKVPNGSIAFGFAAAIDGRHRGRVQSFASDPSPECFICQLCSGILDYHWHQYGQLGDYACPQCGFKRPAIAFLAQDVRQEATGQSFTVSSPPAAPLCIHTSFRGAYMLYNLLAAYTLSALLECPDALFRESLSAFDPQNGRLQEFEAQGKKLLLNLAKNPTGFNQNLELILQDSCARAAAFFINDREGDGRDISWLWDIDFEVLAGQEDLRVFAGGIRRNELQLRLKYAGIPAELIEGAEDVLEHCARLPEGRLYLIANYTALPPIREELAVLAQKSAGEAKGA